MSLDNTFFPSPLIIGNFLVSSSVTVLRALLKCRGVRVSESQLVRGYYVSLTTPWSDS